MQVKGRIIARDDCAGLFLPVGEGIKSGIYDLIEIDGDFILKRKGDAALRKESFNAYDVSTLLLLKPSSIMTKEELKEWRDSDER
jgi:hypothetical protein